MPRTQNPSSPLFILVAGVVIVAALYFAKAVLLPLALAVLLSFLLTPLANRIERWGVPRIPAVVLVAGFSFAILGSLIWIVSIQVVDLGLKLPVYKDNIVAKVRSMNENSAALSRLADTIDEVGKELAGERESDGGPADDTGVESGARSDTRRRPDPEAVNVKVVEQVTSPLAQIRDWLGPLVAPLSSAGLVVVLVLFFLVEREDQRDRFIRLFGTSNLYVTTEALTDAAQRVTRFLRMQFLINAGYGVCVTLALSALGVPSAVMWGVLGFMLRFLPYVGPVLAAVMPIAISAAVSQGWTQPLLVTAWFVVLELVLNNLIEPWLYGSTIGVSAVGIIVSAIFWTWLWGPIGLVLAMPLTVCLVVLSHYVPQLRLVSVLLGDQPAMSPAERTYQRFLALDETEIQKLARQVVKSTSLLKYYDDVLIPALSLAERDRHAGLLSPEQETFLEEAAEDLVEELEIVAKTEKTEAATAGDADDPPMRVLCIPLRDRADQTTTRMLAQLLSGEGFRVDVASVNSLTNELVDEVARLESQIAVISILPPCSPRSSRLLTRRLQARYAELPIVVGYWSAVLGEHLEARFELSDPSRLVTSLAEAVEAVRRTATQLQSKPTPRPSAIEKRPDSFAVAAGQNG
jgi:predicted PurR-regulated permease PerM